MGLDVHIPYKVFLGLKIISNMGIEMINIEKVIDTAYRLGMYEVGDWVYNNFDKYFECLASNFEDMEIQ